MHWEVELRKRPCLEESRGRIPGTASRGLSPREPLRWLGEVQRCSGKRLYIPRLHASLPYLIYQSTSGEKTFCYGFVEHLVSKDLSEFPQSPRKCKSCKDARTQN